MSEYPGSPLALRMAVLIRMSELGVSREMLAEATGMTPITVLEIALHTPGELARLAVVLDWPTDHFDKTSRGPVNRPWFAR